MTAGQADVSLVAQRIYWVRGQKVMLDSDLAALYAVRTSALNQALKRNQARFPADFAFQVSREEWRDLMSQFVTSQVADNQANEGSPGGGRRKLPWVFTEHGAVMAASILNSDRAVAASVYVVRAFVQLRTLLATHADLARRLDELEASTDQRFQEVFQTLRALLRPEADNRKRVGFRQSGGSGK